MEEQDQVEFEMSQLLRKYQAMSENSLQFLAQASHDIRNPMHAILGFADLGIKKIKKGKPVEEILECLKRVKNTGDKLVYLLDDILDLAKLKSGHVEYDYKEFDLVMLCKVCVADFQAKIDEKNILLDLTYDSNEVVIRADRKRVNQVVQNLLSNAVKFTRVESKIEINIRKGNEASFSIKDCGPGVDPEQLEAIFNDYKQTTNGKKKTGGIGLGLSIARQIVRDHRGRIWAENSPEQGSLFCFSLPNNNN